MVIKLTDSENPKETVQMSLKLPKNLRKDLQIHSIRKEEKINKMMVRYLTEGLEREKELFKD